MATYKKSLEMRKSIIEATEHIVLEKGYHQTSIKEIADYLGIPRSLIYYYFKSQKDLMNNILETHYAAMETTVEELLPQGEDPLVRQILKNILFFRRIAFNPLFTDYIISSTDYPSRGSIYAAEHIAKYFSESESFFLDCGMSVDSNRFRVHVLITEVVWKSLITGVHYKTVDLTERELMEYYLERTIMVTFGLDWETLSPMLDKAFLLADQAQ